MKILVINCGSSSLKYQLIDMNDEHVMAKGNYERIGEQEAFLTHKVNGNATVIKKAAMEEGYLPLVIDGIKRVLDGTTNLNELNNKLALY